MKVRSRRVRDRSMSSMPAMPRPERGGGNCESRVALLRCGCEVKPLPPAEKFLLELREPGRIPPRKDMSGAELEDSVWCRYCAGPRAIRTRRPLAWSGVRAWWTFCAWPWCPGDRGRRGSLRSRTVVVSGGDEGDGQTERNESRSTWESMFRSPRSTSIADRVRLVSASDRWEIAGTSGLGPLEAGRSSARLAG